MTESLCFYVLKNCCVDFSLKNQIPKEITLTCFKCPCMLDILLSNWLPELQSYEYDFYLISRHDTDCLFLKPYLGACLNLPNLFMHVWPTFEFLILTQCI